MPCLDQLSPQDRKSLFSAIHGNRHFYWIGSGFSRNFGYVSWENILKKIKDDIGYNSILPSNYLHAAEILCSFFNENQTEKEQTFNQTVMDTLKSTKKDTTHPSWTKKFTQFAPNTIVTTNWDNVLETIFDNTPTVIVRGNKSPQLSEERNIFKIHGDQSNIDKIVITQSQYNSFQREDTYLKSKVFTLFSEQVPIFIGYSLTDPNIFYIYDEVVDHLDKDRPPSFMIIHPQEEKSKLEQTKHLFANKNICLIQASIEDFFDDLETGINDFKNTISRFKQDHQDILDRLEPLIVHATKKGKASRELIEEFKRDSSRNKAIKAFIDLLENVDIYKEFGGTLMNPSGSIPSLEAHSLIQSIIKISNEMENKISSEQRQKIGQFILNNCQNNPNLWDFDEAKTPFTDLLSFHLDRNDPNFSARIELLKSLLDFGGTNYAFGKCWAIGSFFTEKKEWLSIAEIEALLTQIENEIAAGSFQKRHSLWWLRIIKQRDNLDKETEERINAIIAQN